MVLLIASRTWHIINSALLSVVVFVLIVGAWRCSRTSLWAGLDDIHICHLLSFSIIFLQIITEYQQNTIKKKI